VVANKIVYARTRFVGFHKWADAPEQHKYLSYPHRHEFHVEVAVKVKGSDREVEFNELQYWTDCAITRLFNVGGTAVKYDEMFGVRSFSCEQYAEQIGQELVSAYDIELDYVDVSEDGKNGARVYFSNGD
jgi:hypothetical protein